MPNIPASQLPVPLTASLADLVVASQVVAGQPVTVAMPLALIVALIEGALPPPPAPDTRLPLVFVFGGKPAAGQVVNVPLVLELVIAANFDGSATISGVLPTANMVFTLSQLVPGAAPTVIGTITLLPSGAMAAVFSQQAEAACGSPGALRMMAPAVQDVSGADISITLLATRA